MDDKITLTIVREDFDRLKSWQLLSWCIKHGANEFTITPITATTGGGELVYRFDEAAFLYKLPAAQRENLSASNHRSFIRETWLWDLNSASFAVLQEFLPDGLFTYGSAGDEWFEDPTFYRQGS